MYRKILLMIMSMGIGMPLLWTHELKGAQQEKLQDSKWDDEDFDDEAWLDEEDDADVAAQPEQAPVKEATPATPAQEKKPEENSANKEQAAADNKSEVKPEEKKEEAATSQPSEAPKKQEPAQSEQAAPAAPQAPSEVKAEQPKQPESTVEATKKTPEVPQMPEPPKPATQLSPEQQQKALADEGPTDIGSIDTVDVTSPEGNWLFKRIWWQKSKDLYGKIRATVDQIADARMHFYTEHVRIDRDLLDPFYTAVGFDQGKLSEIAAALVKQLDKKREKKGVLDEQEQEYYTTLMNAKDMIEDFKVSVQTIELLSNNLRDALIKLVEQLGRARSHESEAWRLLNEIAQELNDKRAREYYYAVLTQWQNVKDIYAYITGPYSQHFSQLVTTLVQKTEGIKKSLADLQEKGVKFSKDVEEHLEAGEKAEAPQPVPCKKEQKQGWGAWIASWFGF